MSHCVTGILLKRPFVRFPRSHLYLHSGLRAPPLSHTHICITSVRASVALLAREFMTF